MKIYRRELLPDSKAYVETDMDLDFYFLYQPHSVEQVFLKDYFGDSFQLFYEDNLIAEIVLRYIWYRGEYVEVNKRSEWKFKNNKILSISRDNFVLDVNNGNQLAYLTSRGVVDWIESMIKSWTFKEYVPFKMIQFDEDNLEPELALIMLAKYLLNDPVYRSPI